MLLFICYLVSCKRSPSLQKEWEKYITDNTKYPVMKDMEDFLVRNSFALESLKESERESSSKRDCPKSAARSKPKSIHLIEKKLCGEAHFLSSRAKYLKLTIPDCIFEVKGRKLCINCSRFGHFAHECHSFTRKKCSPHHKASLQREITRTEVPPEQEKSEQKEEEPKTFTVATASKSNAAAC